jgi:hypothetical protein
LAASPVIYTNFDTYIEGMSQDGAFGEDLEIMAFCACYEVSVGVCHFASDWFDNGGEWQMHTFTHPRSRATIMLLNADGRAHYDWISCPKTLAPATAPAPAPGGDRVVVSTSFSNVQLFDSQVKSLQAIENAEQVAIRNKRLATVAIVTPTSSGKDLIPLLWAVKKQGVAVVFVPYVHLTDAADKYAADFNCTVERFSSARTVHNSAATCVVIPYEHADEVITRSACVAAI